MEDESVCQAPTAFTVHWILYTASGLIWSVAD